jgi:superoxide dismutase, Cu-Zn family
MILFQSLFQNIVAAQLVAVAFFEPDIQAANNHQGIVGKAEFTQVNRSSPLRISLTLQGLEPNSVHGWHIHQFQVRNRNCSTAGGHFNPENKTHGPPESTERHYGDLGNLVANQVGSVNITIYDSLLNIFNDPSFSPMPRGFVIHEKRDDLGMGNDTGSKTTGNAGARLACGNIELISSKATPISIYFLVFVNSLFLLWL